MCLLPNNAEAKRMSFNFICLTSNPAIRTTKCVCFVSPVISLALKVRTEHTVYMKRTFTKEVSILSVARQPKSGLGRITVDVTQSDTHTHGWTPLKDRSSRHTCHYLHYKQKTQQWDSKSRSSNQRAADTDLRLNGHCDRRKFPLQVSYPPPPINFTTPLVISTRDSI
jgi:hypothetical protein